MPWSPPRDIKENDEEVAAPSEAHQCTTQDPTLPKVREQGGQHVDPTEGEHDLVRSMTHRKQNGNMVRSAKVEGPFA